MKMRFGGADGSGYVDGCGGRVRGYNAGEEAGCEEAGVRQAMVQGPGCGGKNSVVEERDGSAQSVKDHVWGVGGGDTLKCELRTGGRTPINTNPTGPILQFRLRQPTYPDWRRS